MTWKILFTRTWRNIGLSQESIDAGLLRVECDFPGFLKETVVWKNPKEGVEKNLYRLTKELKKTMARLDGDAALAQGVLDICRQHAPRAKPGLQCTSLS